MVCQLSSQLAVHTASVLGLFILLESLEGSKPVYSLRLFSLACSRPQGNLLISTLTSSAPKEPRDYLCLLWQAAPCQFSTIPLPVPGGRYAYMFCLSESSGQEDSTSAYSKYLKFQKRILGVPNFKTGWTGRTFSSPRMRRWEGTKHLTFMFRKLFPTTLSYHYNHFYIPKISVSSFSSTRTVSFIYILSKKDDHNV